MEDKKMLDEITESVEESLNTIPTEMNLTVKEFNEFDDSELESNDELVAEVDEEYTPSIEEAVLPIDKSISKKIDIELEGK